MLTSFFQNRAASYLAAVLAIAAVTAICAPFHDQLNDTTVALALVLVVLFVATLWGRGPGMVASALGMLCFKFFFLPPLYTLTIADPQYWIVLVAFIITASTAGHLSVTAKRRAAEAEAERKAARLASAYNRSLIEASLDPLVTIGSDGKITDVNAATEAVTGCTRAELIGTDFSDYFTEPEKAEAGYQQVFREGFVRDYALGLRHRDGHTTPVVYNASVYRDETGGVAGVFAAARDITERKRAEEALQKSADEIRDLYNRAPCGYHSLGPDGVFVRINDTELLWLGYAREEVIGKKQFTDLITLESLKTFERNFPRLKTEGVIRDLEFDMVRKDGTILPVLLSATAITDREGSYLMSRSTVYDNTERKRAEETLRLSEANLNRAQEIAHVGSWYLDVTQNRLTWSDEVYRIFGILKGTALTYEAFLGMVHPLDREVVDTAWTAAVRGAGYDIEHRIVVGGDLKWVRERAQIEFDKDGHAVRGIGTVQDITERKRAAAELRRINRALRALSSCNEAVIRAVDEPTLLQQICRIVVEEAGYRLCWVGRAENDDAKSVRPVAQAGFEEGYLKTLNITWADTERGRGPTGACIRTRQTTLARHIATDPKMIPWRAEALKRGYASSIAIPLLVDSAVFGALTIYAAEPEAFAPEEVTLLTELASDLAFGIAALRTRIERARAEEEIRTLNAELEQRVHARTADLQAANKLKDELILREQAAAAELAQAREREVEIGYRIQQTLLLDQPPGDIPGLRVAALTVPSQRIDGDFYVFFKHPERRLDVIVGDVMGKGVPAALLGAATKSHFIEALSHLTALSKNGKLPEPKEIVTLAHAEVARHLIDLESFVTLCYARLDLMKRNLDLVDCGHTGIIHLHSKTGLCELVHGDNLPLGIREGEIYNQISVPFESDDLLLFYSDGVTETRNAAGELFGAERLLNCVTAGSKLEPEALVEAIRKATVAFSESGRLTDDLTCVAIKIEEPQPALARAEMEIRSDLKQLSRAREFVRVFCRELSSPVDEDNVAKLELAVNEAASNIMKHAYHGRADQWIHLEAEAFPSQVSVRLHHLGDPFDPSAVSPPALDGSQESGFGLYLITQSVDEVLYYRDERGRNCIALVKLRAS